MIYDPFLRWLQIDNQQFLDNIKVVDHIVIGMGLLYDKFQDKYNKIFIQQHVLFCHQSMIEYGTNIAHKNLMQIVT